MEKLKALYQMSPRPSHPESANYSRTYISFEIGHSHMKV